MYTCLHAIYVQNKIYKDMEFFTYSLLKQIGGRRLKKIPKCKYKNREKEKKQTKFCANYKNRLM